MSTPPYERPPDGTGRREPPEPKSDWDRFLDAFARYFTIRVVSVLASNPTNSANSAMCNSMIEHG